MLALQTPSHRTAVRQRGIVSLLAVLFILTSVLAVLLQTLRLSAADHVDSALQSDAISAHYIAESGLEQARAQLKSLDIRQAQSCRSVDSSLSQPLGRGQFTLVGIPSRQGQACSNDCDLCSVRVTASVGQARRTLEWHLPLAGQFGSPRGCGGAGRMPTSCPDASVPATSWFPRASQQIDVPDSHAIILTNLAFLRHPAGLASDIHPSGRCSAITADGSQPACLPHWYTESKKVYATEVVASRGASLVVSSGSYRLEQELSGDSLFAAATARFALRPDVVQPVVGAFWQGKQTTAFHAWDSGSTSNGAACSPAAPVSQTCPAATAINLSDASTEQLSRSWCYGADTLVLGFSGTSATGASGRLDAFSFGPAAVASLPVPYGTVQFPEPANNTQSRLYSSLRYLYNPDYLTGTDVVTGADVTGQMGTGFTAQTVESGSSIAVSQWVGARLYGGMPLDHHALEKDTQLLICHGSRVIAGVGVPCGDGGNGAYDLSLPAKKTEPSAQLQVLSNVLQVTAASRPFLEDGDRLYDAGDRLYDSSLDKRSTLSFCSGSQQAGADLVACGNGGTGAYLVAGKPAFMAPSKITSDGRAVSTFGTSPVAGTRLAFRSGTGIDAANLGGSVFLAAAPVAGPGGVVKLFELPQRPGTPVSQGQLCGGICALFDHQATSTSFQLAISQTTEWAAGLVCLKGVDVGSIMGLDPATLRPRVGNIWIERVPTHP